MLPAMTDDFAARISAAYDAKGTAIDLGRGLKEGTLYPDAAVRLPASVMNRHGLIGGATGTGKTKTLQLIAEQLSLAGVPVFAADMKGDLSGLLHPSVPDERIQTRVDEMKLDYTPTGFPVNFLSLGGLGPGVPIRATISSFGPQLLAKVLGANETQSSSLSLVFYYADQKGLPLLDLADLRAVLQHLTSDEGEADLKTIGGLSSATAGVLLRKIVEFEQQKADAFFGEPELEVPDLIQTTPEGKGVISCLELPAVQDRPKLFSTFLMWMLAELFQELPEVGDLDKPKLVFFFDEAHLLFADASKDLVAQVAQTVRLIRSKGVGVFFVTQLPDDVPEEVLAQLGNRVQHALRAFTPRDAKALKATVTTFPRTEDYTLEEDLTQLGTGEAMVTVLNEKGAPNPVVWTRMRPPMSLMAAIDQTEIDSTAKTSPLWSKLSEEIDRESAREKLAAKMETGADAAASEEGQSAPAAGSSTPAPKTPAKKKAPKKAPAKKGGGAGEAVTGYLKSREGRAMINNVARGVFDILRKR